MEENVKQEMRPRRSPSLLLAAGVGALTSLPVVALSYLGSQVAGLPFFPFDLFDWLARVLPGNIITVGIDSMINFIRLLGIGPISSTAKSFEQATGIFLVIAGGAVLGLLVALAIRYTRWSGAQVGAVLTILGFLALVAIGLSLGTISSIGSLATLWLAILIVGWGRLLGGWLESKELSTTAPAATAPVTDEEYRASRRALLIRLAGGSIGVAVVASGLGRWLEMQRQASGAGQALSTLATPTPGSGESGVSGAPTVVTSPTPLAPTTPGAALRDQVPPAPGTRPELTATKDFYRIDINTLPPVLDKASWKLQVTGLFDRPRALTLSDLAAYPAVTQPITQACISNPIGGDLIGTVNYTGARLRDVLADLGMRPQVQELAIQSADGFYESVPMMELMDPRTLLVYGMNGETLPVDHGFPLRIYIPNHYGMKQPKWITGIQAIDHPGPGYWVDRGWSATANPLIISMIDTVAKDRIENGRVPVGGIAWAGDRGIIKVEVQVDNGPWSEAVLRTPPLSPLTWVQWRYDWPVARGAHTFRVRATDGTGALQIQTVSDTYPDGATGYHSVRVTI
jgi:DMSO/TMAO reductase YedYZ molybdopterin-dependent catalytic subunit